MKRRPTRRAPVLVAACLVAAIVVPGDGSASSLQETWAGTMEEHEGAIWVTNPSEPLWPDDGEPRFELELEQVFGADEAPEEALLGNAAWVTVDDSGRVYVVDGKASEMVAFAPDGTLLWRASGPGQGPADIEGLNDLAWDGADNLVLLNQSGTRLDTWTTDGTYVDSFSLSEVSINRARMIRFIDPNTLYLVDNGTGEMRSYRLAGRPAWRLDRSAELSTSWTDEIPVLSRFFADMEIRGDLVVLGSVFAHEFNVFSLDGEPERRVMRPETGFVPSVSEGTQWYRGFGYLRAPVRLVDGKWLTGAQWPSNVTNPVAAARRDRQGERLSLETHVELELYDPEGRWLTSMSWEHPDTPGFGQLAAVGRDGKLYTSAMDPFPQVRRYRVILRPPGGTPESDR